MRDLIGVRVVGIRIEAERVRSLELASPDGSSLPSWDPGAHIDVVLPSGLVRQYSLCSDPGDTRTYRIAVLEVPAGRGGSAEVHRGISVGQRLQISTPRTTFPLVPASRYLVIAAGIGVTPMLSIAAALAKRGEPVQFVYAGASLARMALVDEVLALRAAGVNVWVNADDTRGRVNFAGLIDASADSTVYACGPSGLLDSLRRLMAERHQPLFVERFGQGTPTTVQGADDVSDRGGFEVELARSELVVEVAPDRSILDAVRTAGVDPPSSCEQGVCGTCETKVLSGEVDHRDQLLSPAERAAGATMMICVSRARSPRLVLDL